MANFDFALVVGGKGQSVVVVHHGTKQRWSLPNWTYRYWQMLSVEEIEMEQAFVGEKWQAVIFARHTSPPLVLRITGVGVSGMKELGEGLRLRAFLAQVAMEGDTKEVVDRLLDDIRHERDFASNSTAEIVDDTSKE